MAMIHKLSKSRFVAGHECERRLWYFYNQPRDKRPLTPLEERITRVGTDFGRRVAGMFPEGVEIGADYRSPAEALEQTAEAIASMVVTLFEPAFLQHEVLVRADIFKRSLPTSNTWHLIEVKSSSNSNSERRAKLKKYVDDMAVQLYVIEGAGFRVEKTTLAWVNSDYVRMGDLDMEQLVAFDDVTDEVRLRAASVEEELDHFLEMIERPDPPSPEYGKTKCGECLYNHLCWDLLPEDSVLHLPRLSAKKRQELEDLGIETIPEIPATFELANTQAPMRKAFEYPDGLLEAPDALGEFLDSIVYPVHYLDFETWNPCIPPFNQTSPYQQIPFQYSLHIEQTPDGELEHREFLADATAGDPRKDLLDRLMADIGKTGSVVVHFALFEKTRLKELAEFAPECNDWVESVIERIVDTEIPFKKHWYLHPGLHGRSSIKVVLPTLVPELTYDGMSIADGMAAAIAYENMYEGIVAGDVLEGSRRDLLEYCKLDTLAMVKIVEQLRRLAGSSV